MVISSSQKSEKFLLVVFVHVRQLVEGADDVVVAVDADAIDDGVVRHRRVEGRLGAAILGVEPVIRKTVAKLSSLVTIGFLE